MATECICKTRMDTEAKAILFAQSADSRPAIGG